MGYARTGKEIPDSDFPGKTQPEMKPIIPPEYNNRSEYYVEVPAAGGAIDLILPPK